MKAVYLDHMGDDLSVVNAARVSFNKGSEWLYEGPAGSEVSPSHPDARRVLSVRDERLIEYLANHNHWTPFAHTAIKLRVTAPVPIRTQCFKHKAGFVENEESRRYIATRPELFVPENFRLKPEGSVKQGSGDIHPMSEPWKGLYVEHCQNAIDLYMEMIEDEVCPEQARFILPQGVQVNWIWTGNLAAYARFYNQRTDPHAQQEIQDLAEEIGAIINPLFPISWEALTARF
jgi:thymidylate synthase (FAD)